MALQFGCRINALPQTVFFWRFCPLGIDDMQFGFVPGRGTTNVFFILCQLLVCQQRIAKSILHFFIWKILAAVLW